MKLILIIIGIFVLVFLLLFLYCALVLAKKCDETKYDERENKIKQTII